MAFSGIVPVDGLERFESSEMRLQTYSGILWGPLGFSYTSRYQEILVTAPQDHHCPESFHMANEGRWSTKIIEKMGQAYFACANLKQPIKPYLKIAATDASAD